jgi:hypothetical protein
MAGRSQPQPYGERLMAALAGVQSPRQQEIARSIYGRLQAGESVDDLRDLIDEMGRVIQAERQAAGPGQPGSPPPGQRPAGQPSAGQPSAGQGHGQEHRRAPR